MGRGMTRSRSRSRPTAQEKRHDMRMRSLSRLHAKLDLPADQQNWADSDDEYTEEPYELEEESVIYETVQERYKIAAGFVQKTLEELAAACVPGASVIQLCKQSDEALTRHCGTVFNKRDEDGNKVFKGVAMPTSVSVNNMLAHFSPVEGEDADYVLQDGDLAKLHLGVHVDGYMAQAAHTLIVGDASKAHARAGDAAKAAATAMELACRMMRPDLQNTNESVTNMFSRVAEDFGVNVAEGVLSHRVQRWNMMGPACIIAKKVSDRDDGFQEVEDYVFGDNEVWHIDIVMTTGPAKLDVSEAVPSIFRRNEVLQAPRVKAAHYVLKHVRESFLSFPFHTRNFDDFARAKLGVREMRRLGMVDPIPAMRCKGRNEVCARFSWTVMLTPKGVFRLCGMPLAREVESTQELRDAACKSVLKASLLTPSNPQRLKKEKKAAKRKPAGQRPLKRARGEGAEVEMGAGEDAD